MVKLEEVKDEAYLAGQAIEDDDEWDTDDGAHFPFPFPFRPSSLHSRI